MTKVQPPNAPGGKFTKDRFDIDLHRQQVTCPAGITIPIRPVRPHRPAGPRMAGRLPRHSTQSRTQDRASDASPARRTTRPHARPGPRFRRLQPPRRRGQPHPPSHPRPDPPPTPRLDPQPHLTNHRAQPRTTGSASHDSEPSLHTDSHGRAANSRHHPHGPRPQRRSTRPHQPTAD